MMRDASFFGIEKYVTVDSTEYGRIILLAFPVYFKYNELRNNQIEIAGIYDVTGSRDRRI